MNQCDGCARRLPTDEMGIHRNAQGFPIIVCQAARYAEEAMPVVKGVELKLAVCANCLRVQTLKPCVCGYGEGV